MLQKVESTAQRVMGLITQFFTLAKLEAGDTDMPLERLNVNEACRENILDFYELLSQKNFEVEINIPDHVLYANANKDALQRIMFNLISNAIRYGGDGKYLGMFLRADQAHILWTGAVELKKNLLRLFLTDCLQWKILEIAPCKEMVLD